MPSVALLTKIQSKLITNYLEVKIAKSETRTQKVPSIKVRKSLAKINTTQQNLIKTIFHPQHFTKITFHVPLLDKTIKSKIKALLVTIEKELKKSWIKLYSLMK